MKPNLEQALLILETDKRELARLRAELQKDQSLRADLDKKLAEIDEAIILIKDKIRDLEKRLAELNT